jgi:uncharacterized delta-60 repeat protein
VARLNANGSLDTTFGNIVVNNFVYSVAVQSDGKVLIGGDFTSVGGTTRNRIARLNANGTHDTTFASGLAGANATVRSVTYQSDGKVLIAGNFTLVNGTARNRIAQLNANGSLDTMFANGVAGADALVRAVARQSDGKLIIAGSFTSVNGVTRNRIARLNADGTLDPTFGNGLAGANNNVHSVAVQGNGQILIGGMFDSVNGTARKAIARLNADGTLETTFDNPIGGAAGTSVVPTAGEIQNGRLTLLNFATPNTWYYFKIWVRDANGGYHEGPVAACFTDGVPRLFINEFFSRGTGPDWIEIYNPADRALDMGNITPSFGQLRFVTLGSLVLIPGNSTIAARGYRRFIGSGTPGTGETLLPGLDVDGDGDNIFLERASDQTPVDDYIFTRDQVSNVTEGRAWDGGPRGRAASGICEGARFMTGSPYPPTALRPGAPAANQPGPFKHFFATPDPNQTTIYLEWSAIGLTPAVWQHSPKQHDFHPVNLEGLAYRNPTEMIIGLRSPLSTDRRTGNALYLQVNNVAQFLPAGAWPAGNQLQGVNAPAQLNLNNKGIRSIEWCPNGLVNAQQQAVQRYLIIAGPANGGPLEKELVGEIFSLWSWAGPGNAPNLLIPDLRPFTVRPEGVELIQVNLQWRILFVEDRFKATGYGTRNAIHWPVSILGNVP